MTENGKKILLIIPAYNEEESLGATIDSIYAAGMDKFMDILVIDDGSSDGTASVAREHRANVLSQIYNMGYGAALQTGYKYATDHDYDYVFQLDGDGQHDASNLAVMMDTIDVDGHRRAAGEDVPDIVFGSRFLSGGQSFPMKGLKRAVIKGFRGLIRLLTGHKITDPTSGLHGLNRDAFSYYAKFQHFDIKYPDVNMILQMLLLGFNIVEFPAIMHERTAGVSMHTGVLNALRYAITVSLSCFIVIMKASEYKAIAKERLSNK